MGRSEPLLPAPRIESVADGTHSGGRVRSAHNRLVKNALHAALRGKLGDAESILLPFVRVAVNIDGVFDSNDVIDGRIDSLFVAAAGGVGRYRTNAAGSGVVWIGVGHSQTSRLTISSNHNASLGHGQMFLRQFSPSRSPGPKESLN